MTMLAQDHSQFLGNSSSQQEACVIKANKAKSQDRQEGSQNLMEPYSRGDIHPTLLVRSKSQGWEYVGPT